MLAILFVAGVRARSRAGAERGRVPRTTVAIAGFFLAFLLVYLVGFFNLETSDALAQFVKGMVKFVIHFAFLGDRRRLPRPARRRGSTGARSAVSSPGWS